MLLTELALTAGLALGAPLAPLASAGDGPTPAGAPCPCRGPRCNAAVHVFPAHPALQVVAAHVRDGQALAAGHCDPCKVCKAAVSVRLAAGAGGSRATVWEWGHVPTEAEQEAQGGIPHTELVGPDSATHRALVNECSGLMSVAAGSDVLTVVVEGAFGRDVVTVWLACGC